MIDKPKRKNSPNRRRNILLMIILPTVALMVGFMVLSPQINAWLATDPFTPQCHFEQDLFFYAWVNMPMLSEHIGVVANMNRDEAWYVSGGYPNKWSPDGQLFAYISFVESGIYHLKILDLQTGEEKSLTLSGGDYDVYSILEWSPDSKYLVFQGELNDVVEPLIVADRNLENETHYTTTIADISGVRWSPDSQKIVVMQASATHDIPDVMIDVVIGETWEMTNIPDYFSFQFWRNENELLFLSTSWQLFNYDLEDQIRSLWIDGMIAGDYHSVSDDESLAIVESDMEHIVYDVVKSNIPIQIPKPPFDRASFLGNTLYADDGENSYFYDFEADYMLTIPKTDENAKWRWRELSPSNNYIMYEVGEYMLTDFYVIDTGTLQEIEHPFQAEPLPDWIEIDDQEWLTYIIKPETRSPMIIVYLYNPNDQVLCKSHIFEADFVSIESWQ